MFVAVFLSKAFAMYSQDVNLKIMSFNIQQPYGTSWDARKANAALIIKNESPDVVGTQEAVNYQRDYLITETGYSWFGTGRDGGDGGEGSWVFYKASKYTLDANNSGSFWMSTTPTVPSRFEGAYNRICTYVRLVEKSTGNGFYLFNVHFPTPDLYNARLLSIKMLANRISNRAIQTDPVYVTGDFNSNETDGVTVWMKNGSDNPIKCRDTYRDVDPTGDVTTGFGTKFDYIYCPNSPNYTTVSSKVIKTPAGASDHMPIVATVKYTSIVVAPKPLPIPGKIEAEDYTAMLGVQTETTTDIGGGKNVGFLDTGDWMSYSVSILKAGKYTLEVRSAAKELDGKLEVYIDNVLNKSITLPKTGDWQIWKTTVETMDVTAGTHELKIKIVDGGFNLNWLNFTEYVPEKVSLFADYDSIDIAFTGFGGSTFLEVNNPFVSTVNSSARVGRTVQGLDSWAGIYSQLLKSINFNETPIFKMKVYSTKIGDLLIKFEDEVDQNSVFEKMVSLTTLNQWTEISVDFSAAPSSVYEKLVLFFDNGVGAADTYYFDDIRLESLITSVHSEMRNSEITMSPNPTTSHLQFSTTCNWTIYTLSGQVILQGNSDSMELNNIEAGLYLVQLGDKIQRLVIQ